MDPIEGKLRGIKLLALDFDGVFTDNRVMIDENGRESVICSRSDSLGIKMLRARRPDIRILVISKETSPVVRERCRKLNLECLTGIDDKLAMFRRILEESHLARDEVAFMGNDVNDLDCIRAAGIGVAVADSVPPVLHAADYVTQRRGGEGAIREIVEKILEAPPHGDPPGEEEHP
jgi:YrbI family 3-deoxy-D-manno-octulosonate 8-phosphate phosphatase